MQSTELHFRKLFTRGLAGHADDYHRFLTELSRYLRGYLSKKMKDRQEDTEDIVQDVLLAIHNARHTWRPEDSLSAWIHGITRYKHADYLRTRYRDKAVITPVDTFDDIFSVAVDYRESEHADRDITRLLNELPEKQRRSIECVKLEGLSVAETAMLTGFTESDIRVSIHRGLKMLAARLRDLI